MLTTIFSSFISPLALESLRGAGNAFRNMNKERLHKLVEEQRQRAATRGFTVEYQRPREKKENTICHKKLAPPTEDKHSSAIQSWQM